LKDSLVQQILQSVALLSSEEEGLMILKHILSYLKTFELRTITNSLLRFLNSKQMPQPSSLDSAKSIDESVRQIAAFLKFLAAEASAFNDLLVTALTTPERTGVYCSILLLRSIYSAFSSNKEWTQQVLDGAFERFSDELFIKHAPVLQQENNAQVLLISSGYTNRQSPMLLHAHGRSGQYLNAISKHLASHSVRIRWLGMIVGSAISALIDKQETKMTFGDDSLNSAESKWYLRLTSLRDDPAKSPNMKALFQTQNTKDNMSTSTNLAVRQKPKAALKQSTVPKKAPLISEVPSKIRIVELPDDYDEDDLVPYPKPDSDPEDEDEDPTLINRDKPKAPVYIRDLLVGLRDNENYDRHRVALITAASLIRRKTGFGKEVADNVQELASVLMNLNDQFEMDDFEDLRHEALVATVLADPATVAEFMASSIFENDYSLQQRTSILTALGLGARELAGFKEPNSTETSTFPSKQLPSHLHRIYADTPRPLLKISSDLEESITKPLALEAADKMTGPNALKVRTFSSRIEVEKKKKKPVANSLSKIVSDKFFFPLTGRWWIAKGSNSRGPFMSGQFLPTFLRTLAVLLHSSGPFALSLPQMTAELWDLLLAIRSSSLSNKEYGVLEALLFTFLILLEVNENKERLAREHARELLETRDWAQMVLDVIASGDEEGEKIRALAAAVIISCHEVVEKWQRLMIGSMIEE
jgi:telomere length regulation protein